MKTERSKILKWLAEGKTLNVFSARILGITNYLTQRAGELERYGVRKRKIPYIREDGRRVQVTECYMTKSGQKKWRALHSGWMNHV